jgi:PAT family beta-lactamase induction signal transducer AmpG
MLILLRNAVAPVIERPEVKNNPNLTAVTGFLSSFVSYATMNKFWLVLSFLLVYRLGESQLVKLVAPFLLDATEKGGLGLSTEQVGFVYGTMGVLGLTLGGLAGGFVVARDGLRYWLWPMVLIIHIPDLMFVYLSAVQPSSLTLITAAVTLEQFGYGFGFTAYMMYMIYVSRGATSTSHYALCTGFMALGMMLPGMVSGWIQAQIGYVNFFLWVCLATIPSFILARMLTIEPEFGKKKTA